MHARTAAFAMAGALASIAWNPVAYASQGALMRVEAENAGKIKGGVTRKGHQGEMVVIAVETDARVPVNPVTREPTNGRRYEPLRLTLAFDGGAVLLLELMDRDLAVELDMLGIDSRGRETVKYTMRLTGARVVDAKLVFATNADRVTTEMVELAVVFETIELIWTAGGVTASDNWSAP